MKGFIGKKERNEKMVELINVARKDMTIADWCKENNIKYGELNAAIEKDYSPLTKFGKLSEISIKLMDVLGCIPEDLWDNSVLYPLEINFSEFDSIDKDVLKCADEDFVSVCPSKYIEAEQFADRVHEVIEMLFTEKQKEVIRRRFGIDCDKEYMLKEVGEIFGVTGSRIREIEAKALRILRHPSKSDLLLGLIDEFPIVEAEHEMIDEATIHRNEYMQSIQEDPYRRESYKRAKRFIEQAMKIDKTLDFWPELKYLCYKPYWRK